MKNHHNRDNKKIILKLEKPHLLHILSNKKYNYKLKFFFPILKRKKS